MMAGNKKYRCKAWVNEEFDFTVHAPSREEARKMCDEILENKRNEVNIQRVLIEVRNDAKE